MPYCTILTGQTGPCGSQRMALQKTPRAERGTAFEDDFLLIRAAEAGQGLALVAQEHAREEIARASRTGAG